MAKVNFFFRDEDQLMKAKKWFGGDGGSEFMYDDTDWSERSLTFNEDTNPEGLAEAICNELEADGFTGYTWQVGEPKKASDKRLVFQTQRDCYSLDDVRDTMTVKELREYLEQFDDDARLYVSHDNGYTYGAVREDRFDDRYAW